MTTFDASRSPLSGVHVVEASAGTGKTYSLGLLYLRALLERGCTPAQILVLTFSRAAAQDLKTRIGEMLEAALLFDPEHADPHSGLHQLLLHLQPILGESMLPRLRAAQGAFDLAQISTIHAWCLRVLNEHALALGLTPARFSLVQDSSVKVVVERAARLDNLARQPSAHGFSDRTEALRGLTTLNKTLALRLLPTPADGARAWQRFMAIWERIEPALLAQDLAWVVNLHRHGGFLSKTITPEILQRAQQALSALQQQPEAFHQAQLEELLPLHIAHLDKSQKKNTREPLSERIPTLCALAPALDALQCAIASRRALAMLALNSQVASQQQQRLLDDGALDFDAAVSLLARALQPQSALAAALAQLWPVALIDEFQDTDQTQYAIFRAIYQTRSECLLYLIGDPKQAIYRFRDGDVFAYLKAQADALSVAAMDTNFRSDQRYVAAINQLYGDSPLAQALGYPETIRYQPMRAHKAAGEGFSGVEFVPQSEPQNLVGQLVDQVHALLSSGECAPDDLAVLCKSNQQVDTLAGALRRRGIPLRTVARDSLFERKELAFILNLLPALGGDRRAWNQFVLLGPLPVDNPEQAIAAAEPLYIWVRASFERLGSAATLLQLSRRLQSAFSALGRFGRRVRSALCQTAEWLAALDVDRHDIAAQLKAMHEASGQGDALRERRSDTLPTVQLMTVHQAKGLEFNVVLLPYALRGSQPHHASVALFHDPAAALALTLDFGSENFTSHDALAQLEAEGDDFRLLYVALTRAVRRTLVFVDCNRNSKTAALAHLLLGEKIDSKGFPAALRPRLQMLIARSAGTMRWADPIPATLTRLPAAPAPSVMPPAPLIRALPSWRWSSFSGLKRSTQVGRAPSIVGAVAPPAPAGLRGALFGECVHQLLETLDFAKAAEGEELRLEIERIFAEFGLPISAENTALTQAMLLRTAQVPLPALGCALAAIAPGDLARELKFTTLQPEPRNVGGMQVPRGALTGFVDLMIRRNGEYFVLDFKTNDLGNAPDAYSDAALLEDVQHNGYDVQGLMYARALLQRLRLADPLTPATIIRGALVVYLRGLDAAAIGQGVVHLNFSERDLND